MDICHHYQIQHQSVESFHTEASPDTLQSPFVQITKKKKHHRMSHARQTWDMPNITDGTYYYCFSIKSFNKFYILFNSISPFFPSIFPYDSVFFNFFCWRCLFLSFNTFFCSLGRVPEKSLQFISLPHDFLFRLVRLPIVIPLLLVLKGGWIIRNHFTHLPK